MIPSVLDLAVQSNRVTSIEWSHKRDLLKIGCSLIRAPLEIIIGDTVCIVREPLM